MRRGVALWIVPVADVSDRRDTVLQSAGRTALAVLRKGRLRAKIGTLHLPVALHPSRQQPILLSPPAEREQTDGSTDHTGTRGPNRVGIAPGSPPQGLDELRGLRSRLGTAERRVARLRHTLEQERIAHRRMAAAMAEPSVMIDHLVADVISVGVDDRERLRQTIVVVLDGYGFPASSPAPSTSPRSAPAQPAQSSLPSLPGWERARLQQAVAQVVAQRPDIGGQGYVHLALQALARHQTITVAAAARDAHLTSALARHRVRLALEGLCAAGVAERDGQRFVLRRASSS